MPEYWDQKIVCQLFKMIKPSFGYYCLLIIHKPFKMLRFIINSTNVKQFFIEFIFKGS